MGREATCDKGKGEAKSKEGRTNSSETRVRRREVRRGGEAGEKSNM